MPEKLKDQVIAENHDAGYFSVKKALQKLNQYFHWPGMNVAVYKKCESCLTCATVQGQERRQNPALHSIAAVLVARMMLRGQTKLYNVNYVGSVNTGAQGVNMFLA